jgi:hypothetical protein
VKAALRHRDPIRPDHLILPFTVQEISASSFGDAEGRERRRSTREVEEGDEATHAQVRPMDPIASDDLSGIGRVDACGACYSRVGRTDFVRDWPGRWLGPLREQISPKKAAGRTARRFLHEREIRNACAACEIVAGLRNV